MKIPTTEQGKRLLEEGGGGYSAHPHPFLQQVLKDDVNGSSSSSVLHPLFRTFFKTSIVKVPARPIPNVCQLPIKSKFTH
jgi:hypothetical protein